MWGIFGYFSNMGDKWVIASNVSSADLGTYSAMALITVGVANTITAALNKGVLPIIFRESGHGASKVRSKRALAIVNKSLFTLSVMFFVMTLCTYFIPEKIISIFTSSSFTSHANLLWMLMVAAALFNLSQFLITRGLIYGVPAIYLPSKIIHGIVVIIGLFILVPIFGVEGAVLALFVGNLIQALMVLRVNSRIKWAEVNG